MNSIPQYFYEEIPSDMIIHGSTLLKRNTQQYIIGQYGEFYVIEYTSSGPLEQKVRLGFKRESFEFVGSQNLSIITLLKIIK